MSTAERLRELVAQEALDDALGLFRASGSRGWERLQHCRILANALLGAGRDDDALAVLDEAEQAVAKQPWVSWLRATAADRARDDEARLRHLRTAFGLEPTHADIARDYIAALRNAGREQEAEHAAREHEAHVNFAHDRLERWREPERTAAASSAELGRQLYLDLLERVVSNWIYRDPRNQLGKELPYSDETRAIGHDIPSQAHSMIGLRRLRHLRVVAEQALAEGVPGDFVETGVWRGGACILLAGVLRAHGQANRRVVLADSFAGLPAPDPRYPKDELTVFNFHLRPELAVDADEVRANFERYDLLDERVVFLEGLFRDTLPSYPYGDIAILRMDGDLYSSTMDTLVHLYPRVVPGGWVICDDYGVVIDARRAVLDFRLANGIDAPMEAVDGDAVVWRK